MVKISASLLSMKDDLLNNINIINNSDIDYIHLDVMDNIFVNNYSFNNEEGKVIIDNSKKLLDIHLMVKDIKKYVDEYSILKPEYITIHYEAIDDLSIIDYIKDKGIKCGISIKPNTDINVIFNILDKIDLVLIMSVEPGNGGQEFIDSSIEKIKLLKNEITRRNLNIVISIDGGINISNIKNCINSGIDILVMGSYLKNIINNNKNCVNKNMILNNYIDYL